VTAFLPEGRLTDRLLARLDAIAEKHGGKRREPPTTWSEETSVEYFFPTREGSTAFLRHTGFRDVLVTVESEAS
jgi:hypothetical protein